MLERILKDKVLNRRSWVKVNGPFILFPTVLFVANDRPIWLKIAHFGPYSFLVDTLLKENGSRKIAGQIQRITCFPFVKSISECLVN